MVCNAQASRTPATLAIVALVLCTSQGFSANCPYEVDTIVGATIPEAVPAVETMVSPLGIAFDGSGLVVTTNGRVRRIDADGLIRTIGGVGYVPGRTDEGIDALQAELRGSAVVVTPSGDIVTALAGQYCIRRIDATTRTVTTIAGRIGESAVEWPPEDGAMATSTALLTPRALGLDPSGRVLFAAGGVVLRIEPDGSLTRVAGRFSSEAVVGSGDGGPALDAVLLDPRGLAVDEWGRISISDARDHRIRRVLTDGTIETIAGVSGRFGYSGDGGPAIDAELREPKDLVHLADGGLAFLDVGNKVVRRIDESGMIDTVAGTGEEGATLDGVSAGSARFSRFLTGLVETTPGTLVFGDAGNSVVVELGPLDIVSVIGGNGTTSFGGDAGPALAGVLSGPRGLVVLDDGSLLISDSGNFRIRRATVDGSIETWAGTGENASSGSGGPARHASLRPVDLARSADGTVFVAEPNLIRAIDLDGTIRIVAGGGTVDPSYLDVEPAIGARFSGPAGIGVGPTGSLYVVDDNRLRVIGSDGMMRTIAGSGRSVSSGDGGPAIDAEFNAPEDVAVAPDGRVFVSEFGGHRIRVIDVDGTISTFAGDGRPLNDGDGLPAVMAGVGAPREIAFGPDGALYVSSLRASLRRIRDDGVIETLVRREEPEDTTDEDFTAGASIEDPAGIAFLDDRILYVDERRGQVQRLSPRDDVGIDPDPDLPSPVDPMTAVTVGPNPVKSRLSLSLTVERPTWIRIELIDVRGRRVRELAQRQYVQASREFAWPMTSDGASGLSGGIYFVRIEMGIRVLTRKITLLR